MMARAAVGWAVALVRSRLLSQMRSQVTIVVCVVLGLWLTGESSYTLITA
jgi:hypothetical protein